MIIRPTKLSLLFVTIFLFLSGCAPISTELYRPEATGGRVVKAHCPPVNSFILFERSDVIIGIRASQTSEDQASVTVTFEVPKDQTVELKGQLAAVLLDGREFSRSTLTGRKWIALGRTAEIPENAPMIGKTEKKLFFKQTTLYGTTDHAYFFFTTTLAIKNPSIFEVRLPAILINGVEVNLPNIVFKKRTASYIGSLNC